MEGYDKLKAYTNVNLAAIFSNEEAGWKVMAYIKNVMDRDSITGSFLNSDDTGLTTNVFLTEPRLYGLRVTKEWTGGPWWTGANPGHTGPYPLTVELSGQVQRHDAPYSSVAPPIAGPLAVVPQHRDLDWGDGREVRFTYHPTAASWSVNAGVRYGRTNGATPITHSEAPAGPAVCGVLPAGPLGGFCDPAGPYFSRMVTTGENWSDASVRQKEEHLIADFTVGMDVGLGVLGDSHSTVGAGLRYANLQSTTMASMYGIPDWVLQEGWAKYPNTRHQYRADLTADREFKGAGPTLSWNAAQHLIGNDENGHVDLDWSILGGVMFGKQKATVAGLYATNAVSTKYGSVDVLPPLNPTPLNVAPRSKSVTVPVLDLSLGLSFEIQRVKVGAGYRWERYYDAIDAGYAEHKSYDRTADGPYFKLSVGFGG
jgi:hypothetical protein